VIEQDVAYYAEIGFSSVAKYPVMRDAEYWEMMNPQPLAAYDAAFSTCG